MEDTYAMDLHLNDKTGMLAVFDGHGGAECAEHCSNFLVSAIKSTAGWQQGDLRGALGQAFLALDKQLLGCSAASCSGTTGTVVLVQGNRLVVAGVGDSKAVLLRGGRIVGMTVDHRPNDPDEETRIRNAGGFVHRGRVNACLNISRALGDAQFKQDACRSPIEQQVSPEPDVKEAHATGMNDFLLVCSDGVWNSMRETAVLRFVRSRLLAGMQPATICEQLCEACMEPCRTAYDNITAILLTFTGNAFPTPPTTPCPVATHSNCTPTTPEPTTPTNSSSDTEGPTPSPTLITPSHIIGRSPTSPWDTPGSHFPHSHTCRAGTSPDLAPEPAQEAAADGNSFDTAMCSPLSPVPPRATSAVLGLVSGVCAAGGCTRGELVVCKEVQVVDRCMGPVEQEDACVSLPASAPVPLLSPFAMCAPMDHDMAGSQVDRVADDMKTGA